MAALFEFDRKQLPHCIKAAEQLLNRELELIAQSTDVQERHALNNALHALHALASCLNL